MLHSIQENLSKYCDQGGAWPVSGIERRPEELETDERKKKM